MEHNEEIEHTKVLEELSDISEALEESSSYLDDMKKEMVEEEPVPPKKKRTPFRMWPKKKKVLLFVGIGVFVLLLVLLIVFFLVLRKPKEEPAKEPEEKTEAPIHVEENYRYQDGVLTFMNSAKEDIGTYTCTNQDETLCMVAYATNPEDTFLETKMVYEDGTNVLTRLKIYFNRYVFIQDSKKDDEVKIKLYDIKEQKELGVYQSVKTYDQHENMLVLQNEEGKYGYFELKEDGLSKKIDFYYDEMGIIVEDKEKDDQTLVVKKGNAYYLVTDTDRVFTKGVSAQIVDYNDFVLVTESKGKYRLYDYEANLIREDGADYIDLYTDFYVESRGDKLYFYTANHDALNAKGIRVSKPENGYIPTKTYQSDGTFKEEQRAYTVHSRWKDGIVEVEADGETQTINAYEGLASVNHPYYSYFDGVLYFYKDVTKKDLIGEYTCSAPNRVTSVDSVWENCDMAVSDMTKVDAEKIWGSAKASAKTAIYGGRYVLIHDEKTASSSAKLYDLKQRKTLANYDEVYDYRLILEGGEPALLLSNTVVVAKSGSKGLYGAIQISDNGATPMVPFQYDALVYNGNSFYAKDSKGTYLLDATGAKKASAPFGMIRNYSLSGIAVQDGSDYYACRLDGSKIVEDAFTYVAMKYDHIAAVTKDGALMLYAYSGKALVQEAIPLKSKNYYGTDKPAFQTEVSGNTIMVRILDGDDYQLSTYNIQVGELVE